MKLLSAILGAFALASHAHAQIISTTNFIQNGNFESNNVVNCEWTITTSLPGWEVKEIEQGRGILYNNRWGNRVVVELDGNQNDFLRQKINLERGLYTLSLEYAARVGYVSSSAMAIYWNGVKVMQIEGEDEEIHILRIPLYATSGANTLEIAGEGTNDTYGMTIDNINLIKSCSGPNFVRNGQFSENCLGSNDWVITSTLPGWQVIKEVEQGHGDVYNCKWGDRVVVELDSNQNDIISQRFDLEDGYYMLSLEYAARVGYVQTSAMAISWNGCSVRTVQGKDEEIHVLNVLVKACGKNNTLQIAGKGTSDSYGMTITNISLNKVAK